MKSRKTIWDEMERMQDEMDKMFQGFFYVPYNKNRLLPGKDKTELSEYRQPLADIWETDNEVIASVEMPGIDKKDIEINIDDKKLEVRVEKKESKEDKKKGLYRIERSYSGFYRCFALPGSIIADDAEATYKNGVLEIRMPKKKLEEKKHKRIEVK